MTFKLDRCRVPYQFIVSQLWRHPSINAGWETVAIPLGISKVSTKLGFPRREDWRDPAGRRGSSAASGVGWGVSSEPAPAPTQNVIPPVPCGLILLLALRTQKAKPPCSLRKSACGQGVHTDLPLTPRAPCGLKPPIPAGTWTPVHTYAPTADRLLPSWALEGGYCLPSDSKPALALPDRWTSTLSAGLTTLPLWELKPF